MPEITTPGPPGVSVVPAMGKPAGEAVKVCPPMVKAEAGLVEGERAMVEVPMWRIPDGAREMGVPEMVMPGAPGTRVWLPMVRAVGFGVSVCPATV